MPKKSKPKKFLEKKQQKNQIKKLKKKFQTDRTGCLMVLL